MKRQIKINCTKEELFYNYLVITKPYHGLTPTLMEYGAAIMNIYSDYAKSISKRDLIFELMFSKTGKDKIMKMVNQENRGTFNVNWAALLKLGFINRDENGMYSLHPNYCIAMGDDDKIEMTYLLQVKQPVKQPVDAG